MRVTDCQCEQPGWCERHQCRKPRFWFEMCQRNQHLFQLWEEGRGRGQMELPKPYALPRCRHRGREPSEHVECDLCGGRKMQIPIYTCELFAECAERRYGIRTERARNMAICMFCKRYEAAQATRPKRSLIESPDTG